MAVPVLPSVPTRVSPVKPQVIAPVLSIINSKSNFYSSTINLSKNSLLLLSPNLNTVVPCFVPCIYPDFLLPNAKIFVNTIAESSVSTAFDDLIATAFKKNRLQHLR